MAKDDLKLTLNVDTRGAMETVEKTREMLQEMGRAIRDAHAILTDPVAEDSKVRGAATERLEELQDPLQADSLEYGTRPYVEGRDRLIVTCPDCYTVYPFGWEHRCGDGKMVVAAPPGGGEVERAADAVIGMLRGRCPLCPKNDPAERHERWCEAGQLSDALERLGADDAGR